MRRIDLMCKLIRPLTLHRSHVSHHRQLCDECHNTNLAWPTSGNASKLSTSVTVNISASISNTQPSCPLLTAPCSISPSYHFRADGDISGFHRVQPNAHWYRSNPRSWTIRSYPSEGSVAFLTTERSQLISKQKQHYTQPND